MLDDQACEELAAILIYFVKSCPEKLVPRVIKAQVGASHSLIISNIINSREETEEMLRRFHFFLHEKNIGVSSPP